jgi:hypothetical protein
MALKNLLLAGVAALLPSVGGSAPAVTLSNFSKKCAYGTPELGAHVATGGVPEG